MLSLASLFLIYVSKWNTREFALLSVLGTHSGFLLKDGVHVFWKKLKISKSLQGKVGTGAVPSPVQKQDQEVAANWLLNFNHDPKQSPGVINIHGGQETKGGDVLE